MLSIIKFPNSLYSYFQAKPRISFILFVLSLLISYYSIKKIPILNELYRNLRWILSFNSCDEGDGTPFQEKGLDYKDLSIKTSKSSSKHDSKLKDDIMNKKSSNELKESYESKSKIEKSNHEKEFSINKPSINEINETNELQKEYSETSSDNVSEENKKPNLLKTLEKENERKIIIGQNGFLSSSFLQFSPLDGSVVDSTNNSLSASIDDSISSNSLSPLLKEEIIIQDASKNLKLNQIDNDGVNLIKSEEATNISTLNKKKLISHNSSIEDNTQTQLNNITIDEETNENSGLISLDSSNSLIQTPEKTQIIDYKETHSENTRKCSICKIEKSVDDYSKKQWKIGDKRKCKTCMQEKQ